MANRLSAIITKTGDNGTTGLADGSRHSKHDIRLHCLGEVDELNAVIGLCASFIQHQDTLESLLHIQHDLFDLGAELCQPGKQLMQGEHVEYLNRQAEVLNQQLPALKEFILPGGTTANSYLHLARTVCRRAERNLVALNERESVNPDSLKYLNRLSDLLFIMARFSAQQSGQAEIFWQSSYSRIKPQD